MSSTHDVPRAARLGTLGVMVALSAAACEAVDHTMGAGTVDDLLNAGGADSADESDSAEDEGINGLGGVNGVNGSVNTTGGFNGVNSSVNSCTQLNSFQAEGQCLLEAECDLILVSSQCFAVDGLLHCDCSNVLPGIEFLASGMTLSDACAQTLGACLNWPDVASGLSCITVGEVNQPDYCVHDNRCDLDIDGDSDLIATYFMRSDCSWNDQRWTCDCGPPSGPATGPRFTLATASSDPPCLDARGWCGGIGVEPTGNRTCTLTDQRQPGEFNCVADMECERAVTLSGQEAMMYEQEAVECADFDNGQYSCLCLPWGVLTPVVAEDLASACAAAVSLCETEG